MNLKEDLLSITTRLIVEEGFDYNTARKRANLTLLRNKKNQFKKSLTREEIDEAVKGYLEFFYADDLKERLIILRHKSLSLMEELSKFRPIMIGEVSRDIATAFTFIKICVFSDSSKEILVQLFDKNVNPKTSELKHPFTQKNVEVLDFDWDDHKTLLYCLPCNDLNFSSKGISLNTLKTLIEN